MPEFPSSTGMPMSDAPEETNPEPKTLMVKLYEAGIQPCDVAENLCALGFLERKWNGCYRTSRESLSPEQVKDAETYLQSIKKTSGMEAENLGVYASELFKELTQLSRSDIKAYMAANGEEMPGILSQAITGFKKAIAAPFKKKAADKPKEHEVPEEDETPEESSDALTAMELLQAQGYHPVAVAEELVETGLLKEKFFGGYKKADREKMSKTQKKKSGHLIQYFMNMCNIVPTETERFRDELTTEATEIPFSKIREYRKGLEAKREAKRNAPQPVVKRPLTPEDIADANAAKAEVEKLVEKKIQETKEKFVIATVDEDANAQRILSQHLLALQSVQKGEQFVGDILQKTEMSTAKHAAFLNNFRVSKEQRERMQTKEVPVMQATLVDLKEIQQYAHKLTEDNRKLATERAIAAMAPAQP